MLTGNGAIGNAIPIDIQITVEFLDFFELVSVQDFAAIRLASTSAILSIGR